MSDKGSSSSSTSSSNKGEMESKSSASSSDSPAPAPAEANGASASSAPAETAPAAATETPAAAEPVETAAAPASTPGSPAKTKEEPDLIDFVESALAQSAAASRPEMLSIQSRLNKCETSKKLVNGNRVFVRDGLAVKIAGGKFHDRHLFLFNDLLLYGEDKPKGKVECKGAIPLDQVVLLDPAKTKHSMPHCFDIVSLQKKKVITFSCPSSQARENWLRAIAICIGKWRGPISDAKVREAGKVFGGDIEEFFISSDHRV